MKKTYRSILILVTLIIFLIMCLIKAKTIGNLIIEYSLLFLTSYYPVSFIFFIISSLFISYDLIGKVNKIIPINASKIYIFLHNVVIYVLYINAKNILSNIHHNILCD